MAKLFFTATAGLLTRRSFRRGIKQYCYDHGYSIHVDEDKGLFESLFRIEITLPDASVWLAKRELEKWLESEASK